MHSILVRIAGWLGIGRPEPVPLPPPNDALPGETLSQFHQRIISGFPEEKIAPAVEYLRRSIHSAAAKQVREAIADSPEHWVAPYHFGWGMAIRNDLRRAGYGEEYWPIWNLDDIYVPLVERAVKE